MKGRSFLSSLFVAISLFFSISSFAQETHPLVQQPRTLGMGGAGVGLADDEYALFQNVAGLAGSSRHEIKILGLGLEGSDDFYSTYSQSVKAMKNFNVDSLGVLQGKDLFLRGGVTPMVTIDHLSVAYILDGQFSLGQYNQVNPVFNLGAMLTQGVQVGYGYNISHGKHAQDEWRLGAAAKLLWRKGGYYTLSTSDLLLATQQKKSYLTELMGDYSIGVGFDTGAQYVYHLDKRSDLMAGTSLTDIGNTKFKSASAMPIPMDWALGVGYKTNFSPFKLAVDLDYKNILTTDSITNRLHLGVDVGMPFFDFLTGLNQLYITYGIAFDIWIVKVTLISYGDEMGINFRQVPSRRYLFSLDFKLPI